MIILLLILSYLVWVVYLECMKKYDINILLSSYDLSESKRKFVVDALGSSATKHNFRSSLRKALTETHHNRPFND